MSTLPDPVLTRRYRRLVRAYPPGPRREEMLDTLLMCAAPGRTRPTVRETVNLLIHGPRARLGRPASRGVVVLAVLVALVGGFATAALAARIGWEAARPLPTGAEWQRIQDLAKPDAASQDGFRDGPMIVTTGGETDYGAVSYYIAHTAPGHDFQTFVNGAAQRLTAAGWRVHEIYPIGYQVIATGERVSDAYRLVAVRDGLVLRIEDSSFADDPDNVGGLDVRVSRAQPAWVTVGSVVGWLLGAALGWLLTGWVSRRTQDSAVAAGGIVVLASIALLLLAPATVLGTLGFFAELADGVPSAAGPSWRGLIAADELGFFSVPAAVVALVAVIFAALVRPERDPTELSA
jgi:hypothetical protein